MVHMAMRCGTTRTTAVVIGDIRNIYIHIYLILCVYIYICMYIFVFDWLDAHIMFCLFDIRVTIYVT